MNLFIPIFRRSRVTYEFQTWTESNQIEGLNRYTYVRSRMNFYEITERSAVSIWVAASGSCTRAKLRGNVRLTNYSPAALTYKRKLVRRCASLRLSICGIRVTLIHPPRLSLNTRLLAPYRRRGLWPPKESN